MSTDGGELLYGIAEDEHKRPTVLEPIPLAGAADRIGQIVATSISEVPYIDVREYPCPDDQSKGYLLVIVPQSARAPYQVTVGGDLRFYGHGAKGNRRLTEGEVARLYKRRHEWEQDRERLLLEAEAAAPFGPRQGLAYLHAFARPVAPDRSIWDRAVASAGDRDALLRLLQAASENAATEKSRSGFNYWRRRGADAWRLSSMAEDSSEVRTIRYLRNITVNIDGRGHLFDGGVAQTAHPQRGPVDDGDGYFLIYESHIAGVFAGFLGLIGALYRAGSYPGSVDVGLKMTGLEGVRSVVGLDQRFAFAMVAEREAFSDSAYPRTERIAAAAELVHPEDIARRFLRHLFEATTNREDFDPFAA